MNKFLLAIVLVAAFSASALAAPEKAKTRPHQRHLQSTSEHPWRQMWDQAQYDSRTERAYVEFRRGDGDGGDSLS